MIWPLKHNSRFHTQRDVKRDLPISGDVHLPSIVFMVVFSSASISFWNSSSLEDSLSPVRHSRISFRFWSGVPCRSTSTSSSELQHWNGTHLISTNRLQRGRSLGERTSELCECTGKHLLLCLWAMYTLKRFISLRVLKLWFKREGALAACVRPVTMPPQGAVRSQI